jgi:hypothetical protein
MAAIFKPMATAMQHAAADIASLKAEAALAEKRVVELQRHVLVLAGTAATFNGRFATRLDKVCFVGYIFRVFGWRQVCYDPCWACNNL